MIVLLGVVIVLWLSALYILFRNKQVLNYRLGLLARIQAQAQLDACELRPWQWRYDEYRIVSYEKMLFHVKPLDCFYPRDPARVEQ